MSDEFLSKMLNGDNIYNKKYCLLKLYTVIFKKKTTKNKIYNKQLEKLRAGDVSTSRVFIVMYTRIFKTSTKCLSVTNNNCQD